MKYKIRIAALTAGAGLVFAQKTLAVCPVCTVAVAAGVGLFEWLGIDDSITGLWLGGLLLSLSLWTIDWLDKKNYRFPFKKISVTAAYYIFTLAPLYYSRIAADPRAFFGSMASDKLAVGIIEGSFAFFFAAKLYEYLKQRNKGKAHFPYEKVALPVATLALLTAIFYFLTK